MRWSDYYEKINDWSVSTAVSKISSLEDMGGPDWIVDARNIIAFEDEKGATRLLNRAVQYGVKFSRENLADIADEYEEELCPDAGTPISWSRFYDAFYDWKPENAKARLQAVTDFGSDDDVLEVVQELFWDDEYEASRFVSRALDAGVRFRDENLEELYGNVSDDIIIQIAEEQNLRLPEDLREEQDEDEEATEQQDLEYEIQSAIDAADYALDCLAQAQRSMNDSSNVSFLDLMTKGFFTSLMKYSTLSEADVDVQQAQKALDSLNAELRVLQKKRSVQLKYGRLATAIDMWIDDGVFDALTHLQINKAQKRIARAITQVENIRRELQKLL